METATYDLPYDGAKEMLLVEDIDSKEYLTGLFNAMYDELPVHKSNNKKKSLNDQSIIVGQLDLKDIGKKNV